MESNPHPSNPLFIDYTGKKFGKLTVISFGGKRGKKCLWNCLCECGKEVLANSSTIRTRKSCGCSRIESIQKRLTKHNLSGDPLYRTWTGMKSRCYNKKAKKYRDYGGRGIVVCGGWLKSFENFYNDVHPRPINKKENSRPEWTIDRINNDRNYSCGHCEECTINGWTKNWRWATSAQQAANKRIPFDTAYMEFGGQKKTLREWSIEYNLPYYIVRNRFYRRWSPERILTQEVRDY